MTRETCSSIPDGNDDAFWREDEDPPRKTRRKGFSFTAVIERFIDDAENGKLPVKFRKRDCERVNGVARTINTLHERGQVEELRSYIARLAFMVADQEKMNV